MAPLTQSVETLQPPAHIHNGTAVATMDTDRKRSAVNIEFILTGEKYCGNVVKKNCGWDHFYSSPCGHNKVQLGLNIEVDDDEDTSTRGQNKIYYIVVLKTRFS